MKSGQIYRKSELSKAFKETNGVHEVYSSISFSFCDDSPKFYILQSSDIGALELLFIIAGIYNPTVRLYYTDNPHDPMFIGTRLIWRDGVWYL